MTDKDSVAGVRVLLRGLRRHLPGLVLVGVLVWVGGCSASVVDEGEALAVSGSASSAAERGWEPASWEPTVRIVPPTFTEEERVDFRAAWLGKLASDMGLQDVPEVDLVRWTEGHLDNATALAKCYTDSGFPAGVGPDGESIIRGGVPSAQSDSFLVVAYTCEAQYTLDPIYLQEWTTDQVGLIYDYWAEYFIPCMAEHGYPIGTDDMPTRDTYVAAFSTPDRISWWPNLELQSLDEQTQAELAPSCPPYPPDGVFYGS